MLHYSASVFHSKSALKCFIILRCYYFAPVCGLVPCNAVMSDETLCSLFLSWFPVVTSQAPHTHHQIGNSMVKDVTYAVMSKGSFATICNLRANHFGNCLCKEHELRTENSSLPVNCNCVSLWVNESQSYTWLLKSRTFLQWPTLLGQLFPTTNLFPQFPFYHMQHHPKNLLPNSLVQESMKPAA